MDQQKLRTLVFEKTGIKIDSTDPVFALVALNEVLLDEAVQRHLGLLEQASKSIIAQLAPLQKKAAAPLAADDIWETSQTTPTPGTEALAEQANPAMHEGADAVQHATSATARPDVVPVAASVTAPLAGSPNHYLLAGLTAALSAALVLLGSAIFSPKAVTAATETARTAVPANAGLTPQQEAQIKQAEKLQKILPKLDAKTRALIEAELQKS